LAWAFLNKDCWAAEDEEELEEYVRGTEGLLGLKFKAGRGPTETLRVSLDRVNMLHRPLLYYVVSILLCIILISHFRLPFKICFLLGQNTLAWLPISHVRHNAEAFLTISAAQTILPLDIPSKTDDSPSSVE
jgi:hypothetical protein